jgi:hypothetical protein
LSPAAVAIEIRDLAGGAEVISGGAGRRRHLGDVTGELGGTEARQIHRPRVVKMGPTTEHVDRTAVELAAQVLLIRSYHDVGDPVPGDVTGTDPDAQPVELRGPDHGGVRPGRRQVAQIERDERGRPGAQTRSAREDGQSPGPDPTRVPREVLTADQQVAKAVARDVVDPDFTAGDLVLTRAEDSQDRGVGHRGVDRAADGA